MTQEFIVTSAASIAWPLAAYLLGSIPFGLLVARHKGLDIRHHGSGNIGATNVTRLLGKKAGILTLLADLAKGLLPVLAARLALGNHAEAAPVVALTALAAFLGHCYPVFLRFRGGKGVATAAGVFLGLCPGGLGIALVAFAGVVWRWGYVSLGSLTAATVMPMAMTVLCPRPSWIWASAIMAGIVWWKHRENIGRLLRGEEKGWKKTTVRTPNPGP